jgi:hypothetical protein
VKAKHVQEAGGMAVAVMNSIRYWLSSPYIETNKAKDYVTIPVLDIIQKEFQSSSTLISITNLFEKEDVTSQVYINPRKTTVLKALTFL